MDEFKMTLVKKKQEDFPNYYDIENQIVDYRNFEGKSLYANYYNPGKHIYKVWYVQDGILYPMCYSKGSSYSYPIFTLEEIPSNSTIIYYSVAYIKKKETEKKALEATKKKV